MSIKAEISLDSTKAEAQAARAGAAIGGKLAKSQGGFFGGAESGLTKLNSGVMLLRAGFEAVSDAVEFSDRITDLRDKVASVLPAAADVGDEMDRLAKLAESPGLEFESVVKAHASFLALGKSSKDSMETIRELGNALQLSGSDPRQLESIVKTLTRMDDAGKPNVKMLHSLAQESEVFRQAFKAGFGTDAVADIEALNMSGEQFLSSFTAGLKSLKTAQKDAADSLDDIRDKAKLAGAEITDSVMVGFGMAAEKVMDFFNIGQDQALAARSQESAADASARLEEIERLNKERIYGLQEAQELENDLAISKLKEKTGTEEEQKAQKAITDELQIKVKLQNELKSLMKSQQISEQAATDLIERQVGHARMLTDEQEKLNKAKKKTNDEEDLAKRKRDNDIMEAKSKGHGGKAERMQKAADLADKQKELEGMGLSPEEAKKRAAEEVRIAEDAAFREKTGRSRIHGGQRVITGMTPKDAADKDRRVGEQEYGKLDAMGNGRTQSSLKKRASVEIYGPPASAANQPGGQQTADLSKALNNLTALVKEIAPAIKKNLIEDLN